MPRFLTPTFLFIALLFLAHHSFSLYKTGIRHGGDTPRYTNGASHLLNNEPFQDKEASYFGYVAFVAMCTKYFGGLKAVILFQIVISFLALLVAFKMSSELGGHLVGVVTALLFVLNPDLVEWNSFILSESLYMSFVVFTTFFVWKSTLNPRVWIIPALFSLLFTALIRPTGWVFIPALITFCLIAVPKLFKYRKIAVISLFAVTLLPLTVPSLRKAVEAERPALKIQFGEIICEYHDYLISMPQEPTLQKGGIESAVKYVLLHPLSVVKLGLARILAVLVHARPYYSKLHNLQIFLTLLPTYLFAIVGFHSSKGTALQKWTLTLIAYHLLLITISFADWDGRYLMHFYPLFQIFAGFGFVRILATSKLTLKSLLKYQTPHLPY